MELPPAFHGWFRSNYPTLAFKPDWLAGCVEYVQSTDTSAASTQGLIKAVEVQLLCSDLSTSVLPPASNTPAFTTIYPASDKAVLFRGGPRKAGVLVQVQSVEDVAHSAGALKEVLEEKREARRLAERGVRGGGGRIMDLDDEGEEAREEEEEDELKKRILQGDKKPTFPRGSGKFVICDGVNEARAFELQRIQGLGLEEIKLGTKLLIHDVPSINGILMLSPKNTVVKGYQVEEFEGVSEWQLENSLRSRLQMDPLAHPADAPNPAPGAGAQNGTINLDDDDDIEMKPRVAGANPPPPPPAASSSRSQPKPPPSSSTLASQSKPKAKPPPPPSSEEYFGDNFDLPDDLGEDDAAEEEALRAMAEAEAEAAVTAAVAPPPRRPPAASSASSGGVKVKKPPPSSGVKVKKPPPSSGSAGAAAAAGGSGAASSSSGGRSNAVSSGGVQTIDLLDDSDEDDGSGAAEEEVKPARKRVKQEPASQRSRVAQKTKPQVLEIDSD
ncbi:hypothetical protein JCM6882_001376 [Rhodosporidiobolus microsporus]